MLDKIMNLGYSKTESLELIKVSKNIDHDYKKLKKDYPIQYLIGYVNFYGYKIRVNENVLIPRYETEYLVEKTIKYIKEYFNNEKINILDIGCGSGAITIALNKELNCDVDGVDVSSSSLKVANINIKENKSTSKAFKSNIYENIYNKYNVIISNPPYIAKTEKIMPKVYKYEPHIALFAPNDGLYFYEKIICEAEKYVKNKYLIALEIGCNQSELIKKIANKYLSNFIITTEKDLSGKDRYIFIFGKIE